MSETHEREKARYRFREFLHELHAFQPTCTGLFERDCDVEAFVEVDRADALDCFLRMNPSCERFRGDLAEVRRDEKKFDFNRESWNKACKE